MIYFLLLFVLSNAEKICINCKHSQQSFLSHPSFAKCKIFPIEVDNKIEYLVSGRPKTEYSYCSTARQFENMCGPSGKYYEKKCSLMDYLKSKI